ncbi:MAG: peptidase S8 [Bacteroidetes bacterium]|nr:MAG: peptidase S8 [Bacteroidota bacterium]
MNKLRLTITLTLGIFTLVGFAQKDSLWHLNSSTATEPGIDWQKANDFVAEKEAVEIIVAVIDDGVNVDHPDLQGRIWINPAEVAGNGIDDDGNGYVDDVYGWNFIGKTKADNLEKARFLGTEKIRYATMKGSERKKDEGYEAYKTLTKEFKKEAKKTKRQAKFIGRMDGYMTALHDKYGDAPTLKQARSIRAKKFAGKTGKLITKKIVKKDPKNFMGIYSQIHEGAEQLVPAATHHYNTALNERQANVGDNYSDVTEKYYGDNQVNYHSSGHGTHVAGIIAANSSNDFGAKGVCANCKIMSIRTVPNGDERDKDVANSIRYAVDNGAKIINMSFGKSMSPQAEVVKSAIKYAEEKNVLLVHAAGNDASDNDKGGNYPNDGAGASNWLEIGASSYRKSPMRLADFSNYGKTQVDLFAPGDEIYSTYTNNGYNPASGTSMASPVAAGVAGYVLSYYPTLTATELKSILMKSAIAMSDAQQVPGSKELKVPSEISVSGGIVNVYKALQLAEEMSKK